MRENRLINLRLLLRWITTNFFAVKCPEPESSFLASSLNRHKTRFFPTRIVVHAMSNTLQNYNMRPSLSASRGYVQFSTLRSFCQLTEVPRQSSTSPRTSCQQSLSGSWQSAASSECTAAQNAPGEFSLPGAFSYFFQIFNYLKYFTPLSNSFRSCSPVMFFAT